MPLRKSASHLYHWVSARRGIQYGWCDIHDIRGAVGEWAARNQHPGRLFVVELPMVARPLLHVGITMPGGEPPSVDCHETHSRRRGRPAALSAVEAGPSIDVAAFVDGIPSSRRSSDRPSGASARRPGRSSSRGDEAVPFAPLQVHVDLGPTPSRTPGSGSSRRSPRRCRRQTGPLSVFSPGCCPRIAMKPSWTSQVFRFTDWRNEWKPWSETIRIGVVGSTRVMTSPTNSSHLL